MLNESFPIMSITIIYLFYNVFIMMNFYKFWLKFLNVCIRNVYYGSKICPTYLEYFIIFQCQIALAQTVLSASF